MIEFRADKPIWSDSVDLYAREDIDGKVSVITCAGIEVKQIDPKEHPHWPKFLSLPMDSNAAQSLFDALWNVGLRPHLGQASAAHVEALKYHLEDMRKLVFKGKR